MLLREWISKNKDYKFDKFDEKFLQETDFVGNLNFDRTEKYLFGFCKDILVEITNDYILDNFKVFFRLSREYPHTVEIVFVRVNSPFNETDTGFLINIGKGNKGIFKQSVSFRVVIKDLMGVISVIRENSVLHLLHKLNSLTPNDFLKGNNLQ